jgi:hypothetical protein
MCRTERDRSAAGQLSSTRSDCCHAVDTACGVHQSYLVVELTQRLGLAVGPAGASLTVAPYIASRVMCSTSTSLGSRVSPPLLGFVCLLCTWY